MPQASSKFGCNLSAWSTSMLSICSPVMWRMVTRGPRSPVTLLSSTPLLTITARLAMALLPDSCRSLMHSMNNNVTILYLIRSTQPTVAELSRALNPSHCAPSAFLIGTSMNNSLTCFYVIVYRLFHQILYD